MNSFLSRICLARSLHKELNCQQLNYSSNFCEKVIRFTIAFTVKRSIPVFALVLKAGNVKSGNRWYYLTFAFMLLAKGAGECSSGAVVGLAKPEQGGVLAQRVQQAAWWWGWQQ